MSRRSSRLGAIGYYNTEGEHIISYKETTYSTSRRRRRSRSPSQMTSSIRVTNSNNHINSNINRNSNSNMIRNRTSRPSTMVKVFGVLFIILILGFGFAYLVPTLSSNFLDSGPSESRDSGPSESLDSRPSESLDPRPSESRDSGPSESLDSRPSESLYLGPSESLDPRPSESLDSRPSESLYLGPSESLDPRPSESLELGPSESLDPRPSESLELGLSESLDPRPSESLELGPSESLDPRPSESLELGPSESLDSRPSESLELGPSESLDSRPSESLELGPSESLDSRPSESLELGPSESLDSRPSESLELGPSESLDSRPSESPVSPTTTNKDPACEKMAEKLRELEDELLSLKNKINHLLPAAHTLTNFALELQGAYVISSLSSRTYHIETGITNLWKRFWQGSQYLRTVIQGITSLLPGNCWAFEGTRGHLVITLSHPITISHVTLSHISKNVSPTGSISSAPKEFSIYGMKTLDDEGIQLGTFLYDQDGDSVQTFKLAQHKKGVFSHVKLQVKSNWGNPDYTCVYSFRVHGKLTEDRP